MASGFEQHFSTRRHPQFDQIECFDSTTIASPMVERGTPRARNHQLSFTDIKNDDNIVNGVTFMKAQVMKYQQVVNYKRKDHGKMYTPTGKRLEFVFRWEGEELILDNSQLDLTKMTSIDEPFYIIFNQTLAEEMGWIIKKPGQPYGYAIGPNMNYDFQGDILPPNDLGSFSDNPFYFSIIFGTVVLSVYCNWRFTNLNLAFHNVVGNTKSIGILGRRRKQRGR